MGNPALFPVSSYPMSSTAVWIVPHVLTDPCLNSGATNGRGATGRRHGAHHTGALQEFSSALSHDRSSDRGRPFLIAS